VLSLTQTCNAMALSPAGAPLDGNFTTGVEDDLGCLGEVALDEAAAAACLGAASRNSCPASCGALLSQVPLDCRVKVEGNILYGGQFAALFSACDVAGVTPPEAEAPSPPGGGADGGGTADVSGPLTPVNTPYVPEPPPQGGTRAAGLHLWLQVVAGSALLLLSAAMQ